MVLKLAGSLSVLLMLTALAGCVEDPPVGSEKLPDVPDVPSKEAVYGRIKSLIGDLPCEAPFDASRTTDNLRQMANLTFDREGMAVGSRELDIRGHLALTTLAGQNAIGILDLTDPLHPVQLSVLEVGGEYDVKFGPDNQTAFVGVSAGIAIVDIRDPTEPVLTGTWKWAEAPSPPEGGRNQNAHMLFTARIQEQDWLFLAPNSNTGVWIFKIDGPPEARKLTYVTQTLPVEGGPLGPHDMTVQYDTVLKTWVLYSADGFHGWTAFDVSDPTKPTPIGGITKPETGYTHTVQAAQVGTRRLVATIQEVGVNVLEIYDATNLRAPVLLGTWQDKAGSAAPQHNLNIVAGRLYVAHYGNGVYVFDLNKVGAVPLASEVKPVAHYGGSWSPPQPQIPPSPFAYLGFTEFYDVVVQDGVVYAASYSKPTAGIHVIADGCLVPGDATLTSIG